MTWQGSSFAHHPGLFLLGLLAGSAFAAGACSDAATSSPATAAPPATSTGDDAGATSQPPSPNQGVDAGAPATSSDSGGGAAPDAASAPDGAPNPAPDAGTPDAAPDASSLSSICSYVDGGAIPYDHTIGIMEEFSLDEYQSCDLGGYIAPLVNADPQNLTQVAAFNSALADWYRARVLGCGDTTTTAPDGTLLLLPLAAASQVSRGDVKAVVQLYMTVLAGHDGLPDGYDDAKKNEVRKRLDALGAAAVKNPTDTLSNPSTDPGCTPDSDAGAPGADSGAPSTDGGAPSTDGG